MIVGESSKARKGMSSGPPLRALEQIDPEWSANCIADGLSSGEGLIYRVRNAIWGKDKRNEPVIIDPGVEDKRLFVKEGELARMYAAMSREGSTLSQVIRALYDSGTVGTMTKNPYLTSGAHVSILGHITVEELRQKMSDTDAASGFANRFIFVCARRQRSLPFGGKADPALLAPHIESLQETAGLIGAGEFDGEIGWDEEARSLWVAAYDGLLSDAPGLAGKILGRGQPQVLRLALAYTMADHSRVICRAHLEAALEVWRYCADSVRFLFGDRTGDATADRILDALKQSDLSRTEISALFDRHKTKREIDAALGRLEADGLAHAIKDGDRPGAPVTFWRVGPHPQCPGHPVD